MSSIPRCRAPVPQTPLPWPSRPFLPPPAGHRFENIGAALPRLLSPIKFDGNASLYSPPLSLTTPLSPPIFTSPSALTGDLERDKMIHSIFYDDRAPALVADRENCRRTILTFDGAACNIAQKSAADATPLVALVTKLKPHILDDDRSGTGEGGTESGFQRRGSIGSSSFIEAPFTCRYGYNLAIGNNVTIAGNCKIVDTCAVVIGDNVNIGTGVLLDCDCDTSLPSRKAVGRGIVIEDRVSIGSNVTILAGVRIHQSTKVLAGSVVFESVEGNCVLGGNPAKVVRSGVSH